MLVPIMEELMEEHLQFPSWLKTGVNFNLPWLEPPPVSLVPTEFPTFDFREAGSHG
jgi:hypothetical protein